MNNLAKYRGLHGLTQTELGEKLHTTKANVSFMETNQLSSKSALECASVLGENVFNIFGSDVLKLLPSTPEDKEILIDIIRGL